MLRSNEVYTSDKFGNTPEDLDVVMVPMAGKQPYSSDLHLVIGVYKDGKVYYYNRETKKVVFIFLKSRKIAETSEYVVISKMVDINTIMTPDLHEVMRALNL